jgi:DNA invertase Pin-like site-specific DNA recombinase
MLIGYACAVDDADLRLQREALKAAGCGAMFEDRGSAALRARFALDLACRSCGAGDIVAVQRFDRFGRSPVHAIALLDNLVKRGVGLRALAEGIAVTADPGHPAAALFGALADFQRGCMAQRDRRRLWPSGAAGTLHSLQPTPRRYKLAPEDLACAVTLIAAGERKRDVAKYLGVGVRTLYRSLDRIKCREGSSGAAVA